MPAPPTVSVGVRTIWTASAKAKRSRKSTRRLVTTRQKPIWHGRRKGSRHDWSRFFWPARCFSVFRRFLRRIDHQHFRRDLALLQLQPELLLQGREKGWASPVRRRAARALVARWRLRLH